MQLEQLLQELKQQEPKLLVQQVQRLVPTLLELEQRQALEQEQQLLLSYRKQPEQ
jgi:hypothetical protein